MGDELDRYYTDPRLARAILLTLSLTTSFPKTIRVTEPCAGDGAFLSQASALGWEPVGGCDVDPDSPAILNGWAEKSSLADWRPPQCDLMVTNIPYTDYLTRLQELREAGRRAGARVTATIARLTAQEHFLFDPGLRSHLIFQTRQRATWRGPGGEAVAKGVLLKQEEEWRLRHQAWEAAMQGYREGEGRRPREPKRPTLKAPPSDTAGIIVCAWVGSHQPLLTEIRPMPDWRPKGRSRAARDEG